MWQGIEGHDDVAERFRTTLRRGRLASTYLFVGPSGIGKRRFAVTLAKSLLCEQPASDDPLKSCGGCESCRLCDTGSHPDLNVVGLPPDKSFLPVELFIGDKEHRNREGLCHWISLKPYLGIRKIAIVDDADRFNQESANSLLKTLEEPPPRSLVVLIGTSPSRQLPTIRSRAQIVRFAPLDARAMTHILTHTGVADDTDEANRLATLGEGSVQRAAALADPDLWQFRDGLLRRIASGAPDPVRMAKSVQSFVDAAGKEASARRDRLRTVVGFVEEYLRNRLRAQVGARLVGDELLRATMDTSRQIERANPAHDVTQTLDRCLATYAAIDRNANLGLVIQHWCEGLVGR